MWSHRPKPKKGVWITDQRVCLVQSACHITSGSVSPPAGRWQRRWPTHHTSGWTVSLWCTSGPCSHPNIWWWRTATSSCPCTFTLLLLANVFLCMPPENHSNPQLIKPVASVTYTSLDITLACNSSNWVWQTAQYIPLFYRPIGWLLHRFLGSECFWMV